MVDIYNYNKDYEAEKKQIPNWETTEYNKELIKRFLKREVDRLSPGKKLTSIKTLKGIFNGTDHKPARGRQGLVPKLVHKDFKDLTLDDFKEIDAELWNTKLKPESHRFYNQTIKRLYFSEFLDSRDEEKARIINRLQTKIRTQQLLRNETFSRRVREEEMITVEEVLKMMNRATKPQQKGLLAVAFEGTKRPNEYLTARVKDVAKTNEGFEITIVPSKGGFNEADRAKLLIYNFKSYFGEFWNAHPFRDKPDAPLFYREDNGHLGEFLGGPGANKTVKTLATKCGIKKPVSLYSFRRGGYTWKILSGMNKATAGSDMGWRPGSSQERSYLGVFESDVVADRKRLAGIKLPSKKMSDVKDKPCPWCFHVNPPGNDVCGECGRELDLKKVLDKEKVARDQLKADMLAAFAVQFDRMMKDGRSVTAFKLGKVRR